MLNNKIHQYPTQLEAAEAVAKLIIKSVSKDNIFNLAISGGSTPKLLFELLAKNYADKIAWKNVKIFWVDERCVPPTNNESNFKMTNEAMLKDILIPQENIFRMKGENNPTNEAKRYQQVLNDNLPLKNGKPYFDLILLGMGDDGHTASIFPDNLALLDEENTTAVATHPTSGQQRITLTGSVIRNAENIAFLITGESKMETLQQIINENKPFAEGYPTYHILKNTKAEIYTDNDLIR